MSDYTGVDLSAVKGPDLAVAAGNVPPVAVDGGPLGSMASFLAHSALTFSDASLPAGRPLTVAAWVKGAAEMGYKVLAMWGSATNNGCVALMLNPGGTIHFTQYGSGVDGPVVMDGQVHLVGVTVDAFGVAHVWVDGLLADGGAPVTVSVAVVKTGTAEIGNGFDQSYGYTGAMGQVSIWNRALSAGEWADLYAGGAGRPIAASESGLVVCYNLQGGMADYAVSYPNLDLLHTGQSAVATFTLQTSLAGSVVISLAAEHATFDPESVTLSDGSPTGQITITSASDSMYAAVVANDRGLNGRTEIWINDPVEYEWTGAIDGDCTNPLNFDPPNVPLARDYLVDAATVVYKIASGTLACPYITSHGVSGGEFLGLVADNSGAGSTDATFRAGYVVTNPAAWCPASSGCTVTDWWQDANGQVWGVATAWTPNAAAASAVAAARAQLGISWPLVFLPAL